MQGVMGVRSVRLHLSFGYLCYMPCVFPKMKLFRLGSFSISEGLSISFLTYLLMNSVLGLSPNALEVGEVNSPNSMLLVMKCEQKVLFLSAIIVVMY